MRTKTIFLFIAAIAMMGGLNAQSDAHTISLGARLGGSSLTAELGENGSIGFTFALEANYHFTENLRAGLEYNSSAIGYGDDTSTFGISAYGSNLILAKGEYHFFTSKLRPNVGLGLGIATISTPELTGTDADGNTGVLVPSESTTNFAISPRLGVALGKFHIDFTYNFAGNTPESEGFNVDESGLAFNYWAVTLGYVYPIEF